jgi:membrane-bound lytic murein transglycosylase B
MIHAFPSQRLAVAALLALAALVLAPAPARAVAPEFAVLMQRLADDGVPAGHVRRLFDHPHAEFDPGAMGKKMFVLYKKKFLPPDPPPPPTKKDGTPRRKTMLWEPHLTPERIPKISRFRHAHHTALMSAQKRYGVPDELIVAVLVVETRLGEFLGTRPAFTVLASMAAADDYDAIRSYFREHPPNREQMAWMLERQARKADWAYRELKALIEYGRVNGLDVNTMPGSIYGAIGLCQFIPSNALRLGKDGNGDGVVDLFDPDDAVHSIAAFLKNAGWRSGLGRRAKLKVLYRYNPDWFYARTLLSVAQNMPDP